MESALRLYLHVFLHDLFSFLGLGTAFSDPRLSSLCRLIARMLLSSHRFRALFTCCCALFVVLGLGGGALHSAHGQTADSLRPAETHQLRALRVDAPPTLDGRLTEALWARADSATGFRQTRPSPGAPASRRTVAHVSYDSEYLYVGARMYDAPDSIAAQVMGRDEFGYTDRFVVSIGSYNNDRNAFVFRVSPAGSRVDGVLSNDTDNDTSWDGVWTAKTRIDSLGWTAEIRIPLSQLRYSAVPPDSTAQWGINFRRDIARYSEGVSWAPLDPTVDRTVSLFGSLRNLRDLPSPRRLELQPYTAGQMDRPAAGNPLNAPTEWTGRVGGDLQYGLTSNTTLQATINPDFGQVEADPSQINLSAFETFFPEKRPFFVEDADIFDVQEAPRLFYSRRIGRQPQGPLPDSAIAHTTPDRTTILGAAKLTGRTAGGWEVGAIEAVTSQESATLIDENGDRGQAVVEPTSNYAAARARKNLRGGRSTVGGVITAANRPGLEPRLADDMHRAAYAGGIDGRHRFGNETYEFSGSVLGSQVRGTSAALQQTQTSPVHYYQRPDADHLSIDSTATTLNGWDLNARLDKIAGRWRWEAAAGATSPGFEINDLGFLQQADEITSAVGLSYFNADTYNSLREVQGSVSYEHAWTFGGAPTQRRLSYAGAVRFLSDRSLELGGDTELATVAPTQLRGGPALRTNGSSRLYVSYEGTRQSALRLDLTTSYRTTFGVDGYSASIEPTLRYRPTTRAEVSLSPTLSLSRDASQYIETVTNGPAPRYVFGKIDRRTFSITTRASYAFTPEATLQVYAQPFVASGDYHAFATVDAPRADAFDDRFARIDARYDAAADAYQVDATPAYSFNNPDFTFKQLRSTVVFRWQYRRGSTLYLVWNRGRTLSENGARFAPARGLGDLFRGGSNTFAVKLDFWLDA